MDLGPLLACACGVGGGHARGVHIAAVGFIHDAADAVEVHQRVQRLGLGATDLVKVHAVKFRLGGLQAQLMFAGFGLGKVERSGLEHAAALASLGFKLVVEAHRVMLDAADIGAVMQPVDIRRRMPCGATGQLVALQKDNIGPAQFYQMV